MRHTEFWARLEAALGAAYYRSWAETFVMAHAIFALIVAALAHAAVMSIWLSGIHMQLQRIARALETMHG